MSHIGEKKSKKKKRSEFEFCKVCNLNHDQGPAHKYYPNHKKSLSAFLSRFRSKLLDIVFFLKNPSSLRPEHASRNRFWCVFCDADIDEIGSSFACANAILHLESDDHLKNLKHFFWKYGGGTDNMDTFRILEADVAKWEKKCNSLENESGSIGGGSHVLVGPSNDIQNELNHKNINRFENINFEPHKSNCSNGVMPLQYYTNEYQISNSGLSTEANIGAFPLNAVSSLPVDACSGTSLSKSYDLTVHFNSPQPPLLSSSNLSDRAVFQGRGIVSGASTSQGSQQTSQNFAVPPERAGGNVHTGAPPPWFEATEGNQLNVKLKPISSSISKKSGKKLNPNRVGAAWAERRKVELEMEKRGEVAKSDFDADWLPNFGRVWQSGSRRESRKEYEKEKQKSIKVESHSEMPITIQPYISKRMRKDTGE
ncbi:TITAN-like protein [Euphorbia lathyris]|uniref:TITAN-like protein n=1 Tax=Euphorbia lathyris TaxID=212925 RepID=UPI0033133923